MKRAVDLVDGSMKIIKLTFYDRFVAKVGELSFECYHSPKKEARILDLVKGNQRFMQGFSLQDVADNVVRIIDYIPGKTMAASVLKYGESHEDYFHNHLPSILDEYADLVEAIKFLHDNGEKHGDIRRDHIIIDKETGIGKWIDFDVNYPPPNRWKLLRWGLRDSQTQAPCEEYPQCVLQSPPARKHTGHP